MSSTVAGRTRATGRTVGPVALRRTRERLLDRSSRCPRFRVRILFGIVAYDGGQTMILIRKTIRKTIRSSQRVHTPSTSKTFCPQTSQRTNDHLRHGPTLRSRIGLEEGESSGPRFNPTHFRGDVGHDVLAGIGSVRRRIRKLMMTLRRRWCTAVTHHDRSFHLHGEGRRESMVDKSVARVKGGELISCGGEIRRGAADEMVRISLVGGAIGWLGQTRSRNDEGLGFRARAFRAEDVTSTNGFEYVDSRFIVSEPANIKT